MPTSALWLASSTGGANFGSLFWSWGPTEVRGGVAAAELARRAVDQTPVVAEAGRKEIRNRGLKKAGRPTSWLAS